MVPEGCRAEDLHPSSRCGFGRECEAAAYAASGAAADTVMQFKARTAGSPQPGGFTGAYL